MPNGIASSNSNLRTIGDDPHFTHCPLIGRKTQARVLSATPVFNIQRIKGKIVRGNNPFMNSLRYQPVKRRTRESILKSLESGDPNEIHEALESAAYWDEDWHWAQTQLLRFSRHDNETVLWAVALGFSFLAVFHGDIHESLVLPVLAQMKEQRPNLSGVVEEAEADIDHFVRKRREGADIELARRLSPETT